MGFTTPSITHIEFIGTTEIDYAIAIELTDNLQTIWTSRELVEFMSHNEGMTIETSNVKATRNADGSWKEEKPEPVKKNFGWLKRIFRRD